MSQLQEITDNIREFVRTIGAMVLFLLRILGEIPRLIMRPVLIIDQIYNTGALSLVIIMTCGMFIGMVIGLQFYDILARFGSEEAVGVGSDIPPIVA